MLHDEWRNRRISWFLSYLVCHVCHTREHCPPFPPHRRRDGFRGTLRNVARIVHRAMRFTGMYSFGLVRGSRAGKSRKNYQNTGLLRSTCLCCSLQVLFQVLYCCGNTYVNFSPTAVSTRTRFFPNISNFLYYCYYKCYISL